MKSIIIWSPEEECFYLFPDAHQASIFLKTEGLLQIWAHLEDKVTTSEMTKQKIIYSSKLWKKIFKVSK